MRLFGLLGFPLSHSFSPSFFANKFEKESITDATYQLFEEEDITDIKSKLNGKPDLVGFNVTIPHKEKIIPFCDKLTPEAEKIGAVNTVKIENGIWTGHNTDAEGFAKSIRPFLESSHNEALILGTGGASKAVKFVLDKLGVNSVFVSRKTSNIAPLAYEQLSPEILQRFKLIVNTTPLGMHPKLNACPTLPYAAISSAHFCIDLIYNPEKTLFLEKAEKQNAIILNGKDMLINQAEASWKFWNA